MKDKHFHTSHLSVCVWVDSCLLFSFPGSCLLHPLQTDGFQKEHDALKWLPLFYFLPHNLLIISNHCPPLILSPCQPEIKGLSLAMWERELSFLDVLLLVAGPTGNLYVPTEATVCCQSMVLWVDFWSALTVSYLSTPWRTSSFTACGLRAQTKPFQPRKRPHRAHGSAPRLSPAHPVCQMPSPVWGRFRVYMSVCASVCVILGQIKNGNHSCCETNTVQKMGFLFQHRKERVPGYEGY